MSVITPTNPLTLTLTRAWMADNGLAPIYAGTDWSLRFQVRDEYDDPVALTGVDIVLDMKTTQSSATVLFRRSLGEDISVDDQRLQIEADADQSAEDVEEFTGKGWFTVRGSDDDYTALLAALGTKNQVTLVFDIRLLFAGGDQRIAFAGTIEILRPATLAEAF
jgi:hypothetical protein